MTARCIQSRRRQERKKTGNCIYCVLRLHMDVCMHESECMNEFKLKKKMSSNSSVTKITL